MIEGLDNGIYEEDCIEEVRKMPDNSVDLLLTDPPYNISTEFELDRDVKNISHDFGDWDKENLTPEDWFPLLYPKLTDTAVVIVFYDYFHLENLTTVFREMDMKIRQPIVFRKTNPPPQIRGVKWQDAVEIGFAATVNEGEGHHFQSDFRQRHNVIETSVCSGKERLDHPTQKPVDLFQPIVEYWSEEDDLVFDPFCGTGTACSVAKSLGRNWIGIEKDEEYAEIARERCESEIDMTRHQSSIDFEW